MNTVGEILKLRRKQNSMSLDYVCSELKISSDIIKKIESDELFDKEYMVYYVGHLRSYSKLLNLDPSEIISILRLQIQKNNNNNNINKIAKPKFYSTYKYKKIIPIFTSVFVFTCFYFFFIRENYKKTEYALIPDLPEIYVPVIEQATLDELTNNNTEETKNKFFKENFTNSSAIASNTNEQKQITNTVTLKLLKPTWLQIRDKSENIIISKLMNEDEEYTYNLELNYTITAGNAGNIIVIINDEVRGKVGNFGEVVDSLILDYSFNN